MFGGHWELLIVGAVALLLFGNRLPSAMRSLGQSFGALKQGLKEGEAEATAVEHKTEAK